MNSETQLILDAIGRVEKLMDNHAKDDKAQFDKIDSKFDKVDTREGKLLFLIVATALASGSAVKVVEWAATMMGAG